MDQAERGQSHGADPARRDVHGERVHLLPGRSRDDLLRRAARARRDPAPGERIVQGPCRSAGSCSGLPRTVRANDPLCGSHMGGQGIAGARGARGEPVLGRPQRRVRRFPRQAAPARRPARRPMAVHGSHPARRRRIWNLLVHHGVPGRQPGPQPHVRRIHLGFPLRRHDDTGLAEPRDRLRGLALGKRRRSELLAGRCATVVGSREPDPLPHTPTGIPGHPDPLLHLDAGSNRLRRGDRVAPPVPVSPQPT